MHTKVKRRNRKRRKRIKQMIGMFSLVVLLAGLAVWGKLVFDVNQKFPQREEVVYQAGEWVKLKSGLEICAEDYYFVEDAEIRKMEGVPKEQLHESEMKLICVRYKVRNNGNEQVKENLPAVLPLQTSGWWNYPNLVYQGQGSEAQTGGTELEPGEEVELVYPYLFLKSNFRGNGWEKIENKSYSVVLSIYPQKQMIKLDCI